MKILNIMLFAIFFMATARAGLFTIVNRTGTCATAVCDALETQINNNLPEADQSNYLKGMANSSVASQKGLGVDYASNFSVLVLGGGVGFGADMGSNSLSDVAGGDIDANEIRGFGASSAVMIGVNMGLFSGKIANINPDQTRLYFHYLSVEAPDYDGLGGKSSSFGFHLQYKIIPTQSKGFGSFMWGGVDITTGLEHSSLKISFTETMTESVTVSGQTGSFSGIVQVGADISTWSIPLEISTNVKLLYFLSFYGGLGIDYNYGSAKSIASLNGTVTVPGGSGDGQLDLGSKTGPSSFGFRGFFGTQINLTALKLFVQVTNGFTDDTLGVSLGLRIAF
jgi:hypothetical protein